VETWGTFPDVHLAVGMDTRIPVIVRTSVECARCGHAEDHTYEFAVPFAKAPPEGRVGPRQVPGVRCAGSHAPDSDAAGSLTGLCVGCLVA